LDDIGLTFCELLPPQFLDPEQDPNYVFRPIFEAFCEFDTEVVREEIKNFSDIVNIEKTRIIEILLRNLGNPFPIQDMTTDQKRRLARTLIAIYRRKGTEAGIEQAILFFLSLICEVVDFSDDEDVWILGESELGEDTFLGPGTSGEYLFYFLVVFEECLDDEQLQRARDIIDFMKPGWTRYDIIDCDNPASPTFPIFEGFEHPSWLL
jgi:phage tail-like protein